jgi:hypothetical protein
MLGQSIQSALGHFGRAALSGSFVLAALLPGRARCAGTTGMSRLPAAIALFIATAVPAHAQMSDWTGQFTSNWFLAGNWLGGISRQTSDANIDTVTPNSTAITSPGALLNRLQIGSNGTGMLTIQAGGH